MLNSNLTPFLLLAVSAGLFYTYLNPGYVEIQSLRAEQAEYSDALDRVKEIQTVREDLLSRYNSFSADDLAKLETLLPDSVDDIKLLLDIDGIASKYGIELENVKVNKPADGLQVLDDGTELSKPYSNVNITFAFDSSYENFTSFMKELEQSLRIIDVTSVNFNPAEGGAFHYTITISTYWLK